MRKYVSPAVALTLGVLVALSVAATPQFIWNTVFDSANSAIKVVGIGGSSLVTGSGTTNRLAKFTAASTLGDSLLSCDGTNCTPAADGTADLGSHTKRFDEMFADNSFCISGGAACTASLMSNAVALGGTPAQSGAVRITNNTTVSARNFANDADVDIMRVDGSNNVLIGAGAGASSNIRIGKTANPGLISLFGGFSNAVPALKRSGAELHVRVADDSAYATLDAGAYEVGGVAGLGTAGTPLVLNIRDAGGLGDCTITIRSGLITAQTCQ